MLDPSILTQVSPESQALSAKGGWRGIKSIASQHMQAKSERSPGSAASSRACAESWLLEPVSPASACPHLHALVPLPGFVTAGCMAGGVMCTDPRCWARPLASAAKDVAQPHGPGGGQWRGDCTGYGAGWSWRSPQPP